MMEYEDNPTRPIHGNANGPNQQLLMEEVEEDDEFEMDQLLQDVDSVNRTLLRLYPDMEIDPNMVFEQLEVVKHNADRVFRVVALLSQLHRTFLNNKERQGAVQLENDESVIEKDVEPDVRNAEVASINDAEQTDDVDDVEDGHPVITIIDDPTDLEDVYGGLVQDVNTIMDVFPDADPQEVYAYLEARREEPQRVTNVIEELIHRRPVEKTAAANASPVKQNFPLLSDEEKKRVGDVTDSNVPKKLRTVQKMETEPSPHDVDSSVTEAVDHGVEDMETTSSTSPPIEAKSSSAAPTVEPSTSGQEEDLSASQQLLSRLQVLKDTFPDADRDYLSELVNSCGTDEAKLQDTVSDMLEKRAYPKLKDQLERERKQALKKEYSSRIFTPEEVLQWFEDPISFFSNNSTPVSRNYEMHAYAQLHNEFPKLVLNDIKKALLNNKQHYTGAFHELKEKLQEECKTIKFKRRKARATMILPEEPDELFYRELAFTRIEEKVIDYLKTKEVQKSKRMEEAKANAELVTCACCFDDENLPEEMIDCGLGHLFCRECVRRGAEVAIGDGKSGLDCMSEKCHVKFELPALQLVLKPSMFSNLLKRIQAEEISNAEIPDLVQCPHCSFAAIMPNPDDKVFRCLNPECLKETCRFCKEPNHIPLRCEEVEKSDEVKMRTYIENKMTDALVRKCYRCSRRFMKEEGCNKMTCVCGATMCYVCRQPIKDYQHFQKGGCPQMSDTVRLHHDEVLQGAEKAKKEFVEQHPELKDTKLKHDPTKDLVNGPPEGYQNIFEDDGDDHDTDVDYFSDESEGDYFDISQLYADGINAHYYDDDIYFARADVEEADSSTEESSNERSLNNSLASLAGINNGNPGEVIDDQERLARHLMQGSKGNFKFHIDLGTTGIYERTAGSSVIGSDSDGSGFAAFDAVDTDDSNDQSEMDQDTNISFVDPASSESDVDPTVTRERTDVSSFFGSDSDGSVDGPFIATDTDDSEDENPDRYIMDPDNSIDLLDSESDTNSSYKSGQYSLSSTPVSTSDCDESRNMDSTRSVSDAGEDLANDDLVDFETCVAASPSSGHGTNDSPSLVFPENTHDSSGSLHLRYFVPCTESDSDEGNSSASPYYSASANYTEEYSFTDSNCSDS